MSESKLIEMFEDSNLNERHSFVEWLCTRYRTLLCRIVMKNNRCPILKKIKEKAGGQEEKETEKSPQGGL